MQNKVKFYDTSLFVIISFCFSLICGNHMYVTFWLLQVMISRMAECTISMLDEWQSQALEAKDQIKTIEVNQEFRELTANIIAHTAFGASFAQGREAFDAQRELQKYCISSSLDVSIPGSQYFSYSPLL